LPRVVVAVVFASKLPPVDATTNKIQYLTTTKAHYQNHIIENDFERKIFQSTL
jgi:hypothetical protein